MDPIADMLVNIKNAALSLKGTASIPFSSEKHAIAELLMKEGYLSSVSISDNKRSIIVSIIYHEKKPRIHGIERVSKPSRRVYLSSKKISSVRGGVGVVVISTPKGILTGKDARKENVGGEILFTIW